MNAEPHSRHEEAGSAPVQALLRDARQPLALRMAALRRLLDRDVPPVTAATDKGLHVLRRQALAQGWQPQSVLIDLLLDRLADPEPALRRMVTHALSCRLPWVIDGLTARLNDSARGASAAALLALEPEGRVRLAEVAQECDGPPVADLLDAAVHDATASASLRLAALHALIGLAPDDLPQRLLPLVGHPLTRLAEPARRPLDRLLEHGGPAALAALVAQAGPKALPYLRRLVSWSGAVTLGSWVVPAARAAIAELEARFPDAPRGSLSRAARRDSLSPAALSRTLG